MAQVISFGDVVVDFFPDTWQATLQNATCFCKSIGGSGANFAIAVSRLGLSSGIITKVGKDDFGKFIINEFQREGVDTTCVNGTDARTGIVFVTVTSSGEKILLYYKHPGADTLLSPDDIKPRYIAQAKVLHLFGSGMRSEPCRKAALKAIEYARDADVLISYDPNIKPNLFSTDKISEHQYRVIENVDIVMPASPEAHFITGCEKPEDAAKKLLSLGPKVCAIKLGVRGCLVMTENKKIEVPSFKVKVVSTAGAGDGFDAGIIMGIINKWNLKKSALYANAVGAYVVANAKPKAYPTKTELKAFLKKHRQTGINPY